MKYKFLIVSLGFALFSMFFGSGNLVFPLTVGKESGGHFGLATFGIIVTGVIVPFLGVIAMVLFKGSTEQFFGTMGRKAIFWFPLIALSLMGPFGVLARCITVAHGSFRLLFPEVELIPFSIAFCAIIYLATVNKTKLVSLLGSYLTPFLLVALAAIGIVGFSKGSLPEVSTTDSLSALQLGFFQGYQTMDLLAAFFFSTFIIRYVNEKFGDKDRAAQLKVILPAIGLGAFLLSAVYFILVTLGSMYAPYLQDVPPQEMLGVVVNQVMGKLSAPVVCVTITLACFTTAVVLASLFSDFLQKEVSQNKLPAWVSMCITLFIAFSVSTLEFSGIARFLAPILETLYPALIVLTIINICAKLWGTKSRRWPVLMTLVAKCCFW